jgi:hypothetical protein
MGNTGSFSLQNMRAACLRKLQIVQGIGYIKIETWRICASRNEEVRSVQFNGFVLSRGVETIAEKG